MNKTNVFILTTEYHFLLAFHIVYERYNHDNFRNIFVFTGQRLSGVISENLPPCIRIVKIDMEQESNLRERVRDLQDSSLRNLFVFTAYRDLETYMLCSVNKSVKRHLVQDGANFYFTIAKSVFWSRLKETIKIYRSLLSRGVLLTKIVMYKKHLADCGFIDAVWVTNPEQFAAPVALLDRVTKINLMTMRNAVFLSYKAFGLNDPQLTGAVVYLSLRLTHPDEIFLEASFVKQLADKFQNRSLLIKLHPYATKLQIGLFRSSFGDKVISNCIPAELYLASATNCVVVWHRLCCHVFLQSPVYLLFPGPDQAQE